MAREVVHSKRNVVVLEGLEKRLCEHESLGPQRPIKRPSPAKHVCSSSSGEGGARRTPGDFGSASLVELQVQ